jgi:hypothetical protein
MSSSGSNSKGNSKSKGKKRSRSVECMTCRSYGRKEDMTTHETQYCVKKGGRFENDLEGCKAARKADKELAVNEAKSSRIDKKQKHSQLSQHQFLQSQLLEQSQTVSNAEKRMPGVEKQLAKLQKRAEQLEWDNHRLRKQNVSMFGNVLGCLQSAKVLFWRNDSD